MTELMQEAMKLRMQAEERLVEKCGEKGEEIAEESVKAYKVIEGGVVGGYKAIESGVVGGYRKIEGAFVGKFLTRDGESVEDAKKRLTHQKPTAREEEREQRRN